MVTVYSCRLAVTKKVWDRILNDHHQMGKPMESEKKSHFNRVSATHRPDGGALPKNMAPPPGGPRGLFVKFDSGEKSMRG